nr:MBL fold metallo-hydrolase [Clostridium tyrobutyricum]
MEFYGAAGCVTGSSHLLKIKDKNILLDCGLYQGKDENERGNATFNFDPKIIDYVILSHAHIDHSGRIPLLYKQGFKGSVICTDGTKDLCNIMLTDSAHIMESDTEWKNRKRIRQGISTPLEPLYTVKLAQVSMYLFKSYPYEQWIELFDGFKLKFKDAGHLLGSAIVEMIITEDTKDTKIVYTGDLGNNHLPILRDPSNVDYADYVIMESTYGDRLHSNSSSEMKNLSQIIIDTFKIGGNVIIPSFAVGRTQEVIYSLNNYISENVLNKIKVYVDSPLASESTSIFSRYEKYYDSDAKKLLEKGINPLRFDGLTFVRSPEESMKLNKVNQGAVIISASGMCEAGRIKHHLKHNLWRKECSIVFVGYQAEGTLGRKIVDGAKRIKIFGEEIAVNAKIYKLEGLSGHADRDGLYNWLSNFKVKPEKVILVHGEKHSLESFSNFLNLKDYSTFIAHAGDTFIPGIIPQKFSIVRNKILSIINSIEDLDSFNREALIEKISSEIKNI